MCFFGLDLFWIVFELRLDCGWIAFRLCMDGVWIVFGLCLDCVWIVFRLCLDCVCINYISNKYLSQKFNSSNSSQNWTNSITDKNFYKNIYLRNSIKVILF